MGSKHLIGIIDPNGQVRVGQYGAFGGDPHVIGSMILSIISNKGILSSIEKSLPLIKHITREDMHDFFKVPRKTSFQKTPCQEKSEEEREWFRKFGSWDVSYRILFNLADAYEQGEKEVILVNQFPFLRDSLFCQWAYVIDFHDKKFRVFKGFQRQPHRDNPYFNGMVPFGSTNNLYYPCAIVREYDLYNLPKEVDIFNGEVTL